MAERTSIIAAKRKEYMPIHKTFDEVLISTGKSIGEYHGKAKINALAEYRSQQSGKISIRVTFDVKGCEFSSYMGLSDKALSITLNRLCRILVAAVGEDKAKEIFNRAAEDEDVNSERELAVSIAQRLNNKLKNIDVFANVDRVKDGDFWTVAWKVDNGVMPEGVPDGIPDGIPETSDDFINEIAKSNA